MAEKVVFTGLGILAPNGKGRQEFWQSLREGKVGYRPVSLFDTSEFFTNIAGEVPDFDAKVYLGQKGLRTFDRATRLMVSCTKLAIDDCGFVITNENTDDVGISCGTTFGSLKSIADFDKVIITEGPRYVNPALFPNTVINSPASHANIWFNIQGFSTTMSNGFTTSLDAIEYASNFILWDRAKVVFAGGVEEMNEYTYWGFHTLKFLSGSRPGESFINCPFDRRRNGVTFGEGACLMVMEEYEHAKARGAKIYGEVISFGYFFDTYSTRKYNPKGTGIKEAIRQALDEAGMQVSDIDYICSNANSTQAADRIETQAIKEVFGEYAYKIPVSSIKSMVGECYSVSGAFAVAAALAALNEGFIPPTVNYQEPDPDCDLDYVPNVAREANVKTVMVINFSPSGANRVMILGKRDE
ncbi:MAG: beta-ketoacyl-[acyl-carrier-protein] synthase family protein [Candidatus Omnitrophica bacterium]|nr:beta-ketoacyl-[acyl-carrier-protein] synthase family protein [Candidatus Omnitrophota bacterium]